jgi:hypothetical protein
MEDLFMTEPQLLSTTTSQHPSLLDEHFVESDDALRTLPVVRVLTDVLFYETVCWTTTLFATLLLPQFITADSFLAAPVLILMVVGMVALALCYSAMVECRHRYRRPPIMQFMTGLHVCIAFICVSAAILIHALATQCFVLMVWAGVIVMLVAVVQCHDSVPPPKQLALLTVYSSILICFVCVAQELTLKDLGVNLVAFALNALFILFRYDWLANHALKPNSVEPAKFSGPFAVPGGNDLQKSYRTYLINESQQAWFDLYTWTVVERVRKPCDRAGTDSMTVVLPTADFSNENL